MSYREWSSAGAALLLIVPVLIGGCEDGPAGRRARDRSDPPTLVPIDSVILAEDDSSYIAEPNGFAIAPDGTFFIADRFAKRVHVFGRDGRFLRGIGRAGRGPGEFTNPGFMAFGGDSLLYVVDSSEIDVFDLRTSAHVVSFPTPRRAGVIDETAGRLFAGYADLSGNGSVATITWEGPAVRVTGPFPFPEFMRNPGLFPMVNEVTLALKGSTVATAYKVTDAVYLSDTSGTVLDSIRVPAKRRNGARPDLLRRFADDPGDQALGEAAVYGSSVPMDLHWMPGGKIALVSTDAGMVSNRFVDSSYLSVIDPHDRSSCVDARIPGPTDPHISVALRGDTLFALSQELDGGTRTSTIIRAYRIDTAGCEWIAG